LLPEVIEFDDLLILSKRLGRDAPWLDVADPVPLGHVLAVAERIKCRPTEVAARLAEFGLRLVKGTVLPEAVGVDDPAILSVDGDRIAPWLDETMPVPLSHVAGVADQLGRRPAEVVSRLLALGLRVADGATQLDKIDFEDLRMFGDREEMYELLDKKAPVELYHVFHHAVLSGRPLPEVARRFRELGFTLTDDVIYTHDY
jgi:hypothetical protein